MNRHESSAARPLPPPPWRARRYSPPRLHFCYMHPAKPMRTFLGPAVSKGRQGPMVAKMDPEGPHMAPKTLFGRPRWPQNRPPEAPKFAPKGSRGPLGAILGPLGPPCGLLGPILGGLGGLLGRFRPSWARLGASRSRLGAFLGPLGSRFGASWGPF